MRIEEVSAAMQQAVPVEFDHLGITVTGYISACITRFDKRRGWWYQVEVHDFKADCICIAKLDEVVVRRADNG